MAEAPRTIRVLVAEDEGLFRDMLAIVLGQHERLEPVGAFPDGESALAAAPRLLPHVALLDIELGGAMNGVELGLALRRLLPRLGVVLLSNHADTHLLTAVPSSSMAGWSYLLKKSVSDSAALARAIEGAAAGFVVLDPQLARSRRPREGGALARLTPRQWDILELIAQGYTNAAVADELGLSVKSVENQINGLYQQLEIDREDRYLQPRVKAVLTYLEQSRRQA